MRVLVRGRCMEQQVEGDSLRCSLDVALVNIR